MHSVHDHDLVYLHTAMQRWCQGSGTFDGIVECMGFLPSEGGVLSVWRDVQEAGLSCLFLVSLAAVSSLHVVEREGPSSSTARGKQVWLFAHQLHTAHPKSKGIRVRTSIAIWVCICCLHTYVCSNTMCPSWPFRLCWRHNIYWRISVCMCNIQFCFTHLTILAFCSWFPCSHLTVWKLCTTQ